MNILTSTETSFQPSDHGVHHHHGNGKIRTVVHLVLHAAQNALWEDKAGHLKKAFKAAYAYGFQLASGLPSLWDLLVYDLPIALAPGTFPLLPLGVSAEYFAAKLKKLHYRLDVDKTLEPANKLKRSRKAVSMDEDQSSPETPSKKKSRRTPRKQKSKVVKSDGNDFPAEKPAKKKSSKKKSKAKAKVVEARAAGAGALPGDRYEEHPRVKAQDNPLVLR